MFRRESHQVASVISYTSFLFARGFELARELQWVTIKGDSTSSPDSFLAAQIGSGQRFAEPTQRLAQ